MPVLSLAGCYDKCRYVWLIRPDIPSTTVASLHTVGHGCRVPLLKSWKAKRNEQKFYIYSDVSHTHTIFLYEFSSLTAFSIRFTDVGHPRSGAGTAFLRFCPSVQCRKQQFFVFAKFPRKPEPVIQWSPSMQSNKHMQTPIVSERG